MSSTFLVTGGAGFIGSNLLKYLFNKYSSSNFINLDKLTYAGNLENLQDLEKEERYTFVKGDICEENLVDQLFQKYYIDAVFHLAAESHVDRSILGPKEFIKTNIEGTYNLLESAKKHWKNFENKRFIHISTDEVYGTLGESGHFEETTPYAPNSPYAASKASSDHLGRAYFQTYQFPIVITNCCNNYGPYQFPEKLIPLMVQNGMADRSLPIYGDGKQIRDWIYVKDHCEALDLVYEKGSLGETYCIGTRSECTNLEIVYEILKVLGKPKSLIQFVSDRPGHDRRYSINPTKIESLGFKGKVNLQEGLLRTIQWYQENPEWLKRVTSGEYQEYFEKQYGERLK